MEIAGPEEVRETRKLEVKRGKYLKEKEVK